MSVGVCIINRNGIALAADSAVTFNEKQMFYNSMNKIFSLSSTKPYGAVTYGNASIGDVYIEQILNEFSLYLDANDEIDDFFEIVEVFKAFIRDKNQYFNLQSYERAYCIESIKAFTKIWGNSVKEILSKEDGNVQLNNYLLNLESQFTVDKRSKYFSICDYVKLHYYDIYEKEIETIVPELNDMSEEKEKLWEIICAYFDIKPEQNESYTGLLFAGYGKNDAFPKYLQINVYRVIGGNIVYDIQEKYEITNQLAKIKPLAQEDIIYTFCKGISNELIDFIPQMSMDVMEKEFTKYESNFSEIQKEILKNLFNNGQRAIKDELVQKIRKDSIDPLIKSVRVLPLSEIAFLAENLVDITSLKRMYVLDGKQQTVGGPTDVAILSKTGGFIWVKRKNSLNYD